MAAAIPLEERKAILAKWHDGHAEHYQKLLQLGGEVPRVWLTRSGSSANDAVIRALVKTLPDNAPAYRDPSWYYENNEAVRAGFTESTLDNALVCFLGSSDASGHSTADAFIAHRDQVIADFAKNAENNSSTQYYLVIDTTFDPLLRVNTEGFPKNLSLIRATSWTKYQRGEHNHFCGSIAATGTGIDSLDIDTAASESRAPLTEDGIVHMPRITPAEITARFEKLSELTSAFTEAFRDAQESVLPEFRQTITANSSCIYIHHPLFNALASGPDAFVQAARAMGHEVQPPFSDDKISNDVFRINHLHFSLLDMGRAPFKSIARGESFGLPDSRVDTMTEVSAGSISLEPYLAFSPIQNLRVSPGYEATTAQMRETAQEISAFLTRKYRDTFFTPGSVPQFDASADFARSQNVWRYAYRLEESQAESMLSSIPGDRERRRFIEYTTVEEWGRESYVRLSADPSMSRYVLSEIYARSGFAWEAGTCMQLLRRFGLRGEQPGVSHAFLRRYRREAGAMFQEKDRFFQLLEVLSSPQFENERLSVRSLVVPGLTAISEAVTSADFETLAQNQQISPYVLRIVLRNILSSAAPDKAQLALAIDRNPRLQDLRSIIQ